ncbi:tRNA (guanine(10)-N2)-methyltransferase [Pseudocercospora fuligena]|uniref:tRNA (guanine(10)-N(2))-methyltransferase n=1 Tax=Pseudocercospora fuligena TaxID=685502 RepID=A0A8H6VGA6_9PEZI|nr:tRNA (guanine(10)-N2)-methyltransferase [Pseudocercospora fuligena]
MEYLIRFIQTHESFRRAEIDALAELNGLNIEWLIYSDNSPFAVIRFAGQVDPVEACKSLISRSVLTFGIHELWGAGKTYDELHADIRHRTDNLWEQYRDPSFRFEVDCCHGSRSSSEQRKIMESFHYMGMEGPIVMNKPDHHFTIFEDYDLHTRVPRQLYFGRLMAESGRKAIAKYNLKKRKYIHTTSMDAELSLITANLALAAPGRLAYDPFMGTGSFPLACAHYGSTVFGSDMDGRSIRGKRDRSVQANFVQYGTTSFYLDGFAADLTNTPLRAYRYLDSIVCDPPYGVREGLRVLGSNKASLQAEVLLKDGTLAHLKSDYIPPKKPYSFLRMIDDILDFSATTLVDNGRLCMWMPVAGAVEDEIDPDAAAVAISDEMPGTEKEYAIPKHPCLALVSHCRQDFNKWSRRLLSYRRRKDSEIDEGSLSAYRLHRLQLQEDHVNNTGTADDLNDFRRKYFQGFKDC